MHVPGLGSRPAQASFRWEASTLAQGRRQMELLRHLLHSVAGLEGGRKACLCHNACHAHRGTTPYPCSLPAEATRAQRIAQPPAEAEEMMGTSDPSCEHGGWLTKRRLRSLFAEVSASSSKRLPSLLRTASRESRELQLARAAQAGQPGQAAAKRAHGRHAPPGEAHVARAP